MNFRRAPKSHHGSTDVNLNLTPLVDVVLQLVMFFMVTTQFAVLPGLKLILPAVDPEARVQVQKAERLEITLTAAGDLFFENQPVTVKSLPRYLERSGARGGEVVIVVSADETVPYGRVIKIMDTLRQGGYNRVVFAARPEPRGENNVERQ